jgi:hypothetical protein
MSLPVKWAYTQKFKCADDMVNWEGDDDNYTRIETLINQIDTWAAAGTPLVMHSVYSYMDNKIVIADPMRITPLAVVPDDQSESALCEMTLLEV